MAGSDDGVDEQKCMHYARFAAHLDRYHFDMIYWILFVIVIFMLFAASWRYGRSIDAVEGLALGSPEHRRKMQRCMLICGIYALISVVAVVMEVFALMALQFCDGEDLMSLYWSTWTVMQIGSLIAIFGVLLAVFHAIRGRKHPPWALALGTPVLVVAGLGHIIQGALHKKVKSVRGRNSIRNNRLGPGSDDLPSMSTTDTISAEEEKYQSETECNYKAKLLGYTPDGATILMLCDSSAPPIDGLLLSPTVQANIIGTNTEGQVIFTLRNSSKTTNSASIAKCPPPPLITAAIGSTPRSSTPRRSGTSVRIQTPPPVIRRGDMTTATGSRRGSDAGAIGALTLVRSASPTTNLPPPVSGGEGEPCLPCPTTAGFGVRVRSDSLPSIGEGGSPTSLMTPKGAMSA